MWYIILTMLLYTCATLFTVVAARNTNPTIATAVTNIISAMLPLVMAIPFVTRKAVLDTRFGIFMAVCAGIFIALFTLTLNKSFSINKVAVVSPIVFGGSLFLSSILSVFLFKEKITMIQGVGLGFLAIGLSVIVYAKMKGI